MSLLVAFAEMAADCYNETDLVRGDLHGWKRSTDKLLGSASDNNFYACAYRLRNTDFVAIAYRGTANVRDAVYADLAGIGLSVNSLAMNVQSALDFAYLWSQRTNNLWLVGHSLGGAYVQIVAAVFNMWGMTFNAPGVLHLVNQYSDHALTKVVGSVCSPAMQILTLSFGRVDLLNFFNKAVAADDDHSFPAVANYRAHNDPVSLVGQHVGAPMTAIRVDPAPSKIHRMATLVDALGGKVWTSTDGQ